MSIKTDLLGRRVTIENYNLLPLDLYEYSGMLGDIVGVFLQEMEGEGSKVPVFGVEMEETGDLIWLTSPQFTLNRL
jgi:hypothetical protein